MRILLAGVAVAALLDATPARADVSFGEVKGAVSDAVEPFFEELYDSLCAWLLMPAKGLPAMAPQPPPQPMSGAFPDNIPGAPNDGIAASQAIIDNQQARADAAQRAIAVAIQAGTSRQAQLTTYQGLNLDPPVSVVAGQQIGNQIGSLGVQATATAAQLQATSVALQSADVDERRHAAEVELEQMRRFSNYGAPVRIRAETIKLAR
jgi:hypothetical protein